MHNLPIPPEYPAAGRLRGRVLTLAVLAVLAGGWSAAVTGADAQQLMPFQASYAWNWHGATVAVSTVTLAHQDENTWVYSSRTEPRGIGRLFPERPTQRSILRVSADGVEPLSYRADAGTSSTSRDANVTFDWDHEHASGVYDDVKVDMPLKPGVQDDLSVQIALMVQLLQGHMPTGISVIDKNTVRDYSYVREGTATLDTPFGPVPTVIYRSQHQGSPRVTRFWCAPSHDYLPMRVQQKRLDSVEWTMDVLSVKRQ